MARVLLVDDDEHLLAFANHFLHQEEASLEIITAKSAHEALGQLKNGNIDVVVSDYQMPGVDGLELLKHLRGSGSATPFIMFTGRGHEEVAMQALNLGADYYCKKDDDPPNMFRALSHAIHQVLKQKQLEDALKESEERYRLLCEAAFEGIAIHYKGEIVEANQALAKQFGYESHELLGKNSLELIAPEFRDRILKQIESETNKPFEGLALRKNGSVFPARTITRNAFFKGKPVRIAAFQDLTYQAVVEDQTELICRYLPGGILTFVNEAYCRYFGKSQEELIGRHFLPLILEEDQELVENQIASLTAENPVVTYEHRVILSNKEVRWQQWTDRAIFDEQGQILEFQAVGMDITERKQMEEEFQESLNINRTLTELLFDGMAIHEAETIRQINTAGAAIFGYECNELIDKNFFELISPESHNTVRQSMTKDLTKPFEIVGITKDGQQVYLEVVASSCTYDGENARMAAFRDITARKKAEKALQESEQRFRTIFESIKDSIFIKDRSLKYTHANPVMAKLFDMPESNLIGKTDSELFGEQAAKHIQESDLRVLAGEIVAEEHTKPVKGALHTFHVVKMPLRKNGEIESICGIARDITDLKHGEEELKEQKQELSELAHVMAHDLRNNLLSIEGYAEILLKGYDRACVGKIRELAINMNHLLNRSVNLADFGLLIGNMAAVNLESLLQEVCENIIPKNVRFTYDPLPTVLGDYEKLKQVFQNLLENAIAHGKPSAIQVLRYDSTDSINLLITNDGIPILSEHRSKLFQRGFTTKKDRKGLGLAIVQKIVRAHGWQISLDESPRTTFQLVIPEKNLAS